MGRGDACLDYWRQEDGRRVKPHLVNTLRFGLRCGRCLRSVPTKGSVPFALSALSGVHSARELAEAGDFVGLRANTRFNWRWRIHGRAVARRPDVDRVVTRRADGHEG